MPVTPLSTFDRVKPILMQQLGVDDEARLTPEADLFKGLGADSLDFVSAQLAIEEEFGILVPDIDAYANVHTVGELVEVIERTLEQRNQRSEPHVEASQPSELVWAFSAVLRGVTATFAPTAVGTDEYVQVLLGALNNAGLSVVVTTDTEEELEKIRQQLTQACACQHDGRGELTSECDEHQQIREERDSLKKTVENISNVTALGLSDRSTVREIRSYLAFAQVDSPPPSATEGCIPTLHDLHLRAEWYRAGCHGLKDRDDYLRNGLATDAAADLSAAIAHAESMGARP